MSVLVRCGRTGQLFVAIIDKSQWIPLEARFAGFECDPILLVEVVANGRYLYSERKA